MTKHLLKSCLTLLVVLLGGISSAWAGEPVKALTFPNYNDDSVNNYTSTWTATVEGDVWTLSEFNNNQNKWAYVRCGRKNIAHTATITSPVVDAEIANVVITVDKTSNVDKATLTVTKDEVDTAIDITDKFVAGDVNIAVEGAAGSSYKLTLENSSASANGTTQISKVSLYVAGQFEEVHIANTEETAYTVAEAYDLIDAGQALGETVYVKGIISQVDKFNESYSSINYWISDDGTTDKQLECYSGKGLEGADFTSVDDVEVGATVIVKGTLTKYNSTYEFTQNNQLVSYQAPAAEPETITFDFMQGVDNEDFDFYGITKGSTNAKDREVATNEGAQIIALRGAKASNSPAYAVTLSSGLAYINLPSAVETYIVAPEGKAITKIASECYYGVRMKFFDGAVTSSDMDVWNTSYKNGKISGTYFEWSGNTNVFKITSTQDGPRLYTVKLYLADANEETTVIEVPAEEEEPQVTVTVTGIPESALLDSDITATVTLKNEGTQTIDKLWVTAYVDGASWSGSTVYVENLKPASEQEVEVPINEIYSDEEEVSIQIKAGVYGKDYTFEADAVTVKLTEATTTATFDFMQGVDNEDFDFYGITKGSTNAKDREVATSEGAQIVAVRGNGTFDGPAYAVATSSLAYLNLPKNVTTYIAAPEGKAIKKIECECYYGVRMKFDDGNITSNDMDVWNAKYTSEDGKISGTYFEWSGNTTAFKFTSTADGPRLYTVKLTLANINDETTIVEVPAEEAAPEVTVTVTGIPQTAELDSDITATATVKNVGTTDIAKMWVTAYVDGVAWSGSTVYVENLAAGTEQTVDVPIKEIYSDNDEVTIQIKAGVYGKDYEFEAETVTVALTEAPAAIEITNVVAPTEAVKTETFDVTVTINSQEAVENAEVTLYIGSASVVKTVNLTAGENTVTFTVNRTEKELGEGTYTLNVMVVADETEYWSEEDAFSVVLDATTVGIQTIATERVVKGNAYTINGVKVDTAKSLQKGLYIINGKKVVVK